MPKFKKIICPQCGKRCKVDYRRTFCSRKCYLEYIKPPTKHRLQCDKEFISCHDTIFCSRSCASTYNNKSRKKPDKHCIVCGQILSQRNIKGYCQKCGIDRRYQEYIARWLDNKETGTIGQNNDVSNYIRRYLFEKYNSKCSRCGWGEINPVTKKSPLNVEHIDGNCENNRPENLDLLCPNCHSLTPTYGSLNKGHSHRYARYKKK